VCLIRAYLRASTDEQDATRALDQVKAFAAERGMQIAICSTRLMRTTYVGS
jgi:DNA invertase Pin-like site-specific DNA recombinase